MKLSFQEGDAFKELPKSVRKDRKAELEILFDEAERGLNARLPLPRKLRLELSDTKNNDEGKVATTVHQGELRIFPTYFDLMKLVDVDESVDVRPLKLGIAVHELSHIAELEDERRNASCGELLFDRVVKEGKADKVMQQVLTERGLPLTTRVLNRAIVAHPKERKRVLRALNHTRNYKGTFWQVLTNQPYNEALANFEAEAGGDALYIGGGMVVSQFMETQKVDVFTAHQHPPFDYIPSFHQLVQDELFN